MPWSGNDHWQNIKSIWGWILITISIFSSQPIHFINVLTLLKKTILTSQLGQKPDLLKKIDCSLFAYFQACYKDLVTLTPQNIQSVHRKLTSDCWVGLRKNFSSTTNSTTMTWPGWTRWANGDPLVFQNWYPGWPVLKSSLPKSYCCSCSCTCPATPTPTMTGFTEFTSSNMTSFTSVTDQSWTNSSGLNETNSAPMTTALPRAAACDRSPMLPDIPNIDENYIEDSCVAMLSFGAWVEKNCSELLPSICYEGTTHLKPLCGWLPLWFQISHSWKITTIFKYI